MTKIEIRAVQGQLSAAGKKLTGYAAVFNSPSEDLGGFIEIIKPGAFGDLVNDDVRALINHDSNLVLGRTTAGTLKLTEDATGLRFELDLPDTQAAADLAVSIERKDVTGCSFAFIVADGGENWITAGDKIIREITKFDSLREVSIVTFPAYPDTSVAQRSLASTRNAPTWKDQLRKLRQQIASMK